jgi:K+/H+ antiporter YhaU regulatory subunit KhtT
MTFIVPPADFVIKDSDVLIVMGDEKMLEKMTVF